MFPPHPQLMGFDLQSLVNLLTHSTKQEAELETTSLPGRLYRNYSNALQVHTIFLSYSNPKKLWNFHIAPRNSNWHIRVTAPYCYLFKWLNSVNVVYHSVKLMLMFVHSFCQVVRCSRLC